MPFVTANGARLHVQRLAAKSTEPEQPTVVFIHGLGWDSLASFYFTLGAPAASAGFHVVTYDLRGHGKSERPAQGYTLGDTVADLAGLLDELAITGPVHLVGNCFGGTVAFSFAHRYPERVASLVVIESEPATGAWSVKLRELLGNATDHLLHPDVLNWISENRGAHTARRSVAAGKIFTATTMASEIPRGPLLGEAELAAIGCPVLAIFGSESDLVQVADWLPRLLPSCKVAIIEGRDHSVLAEAPQSVRELMVPWINRHRPQHSAVGAPESEGEHTR
ncbi:alpha/beta fold hydrolase [Sciscionella marina]|uniref:alpha/beta fold hydrolase n=1 Tax=Sciscionella marina TaxID=508770 RepID=UPI00037C50AC|nr:alpha/beta fold hydrolase [Sciscionella marina]